DDFQKQILTIFTENLKDDSPMWNFETVYDYREDNAKLKNWMNNEGFTMLIRCTDKYNRWLDKLLPRLNQSETVVVFSMWGEYINEGGQHAIKSYCDMVARFDNVVRLHTSGHASAESLTKVCTRTNPRLAIIPIHSERSANFLNLPISEELKSKVILENTFTI
ncbi:MAG: MBL fold metallo-hydrolase RNA specificity domain-containing protein, partial [Rikenellaceae bacterium]